MICAMAGQGSTVKGHCLGRIADLSMAVINHEHEHSKITSKTHEECASDNAMGKTLLQAQLGNLLEKDLLGCLHNVWLCCNMC